MLTLIADTPGILETFIAKLAAMGLRYCRYLGERDIRFGD